MPYARRRFDCMDCGGDAYRRAPIGAVVRCISCAIRRSEINANQIHTRSGEGYRKWADGMARVARQAQQLVAIGSEIDSIGYPGEGVP